MSYKKINKEDIKEGDEIQYCGFYILKAKELKDAGFEPEYFFVEVEESKKFKCSLCGKPREDENKSFCDKCDELEYDEETGESGTTREGVIKEVHKDYSNKDEI